MTHAIRLFNIFNSPRQQWLREPTTILCYTYSASSFQCYFPFLLISIFLSIAVLLRNVFCVPCTFCDNVQQCADTAILSGNCSAVWDAVSLQYTCTEGSVSVHVHWGLSIGTHAQQVSHTRVYLDLPCACVSHVYPFCLSLQRGALRKWTAANYWSRRTWAPTKHPLPRNEGRLFAVKALSNSGCLCTRDFKFCNNNTSD